MILNNRPTHHCKHKEEQVPAAKMKWKLYLVHQQVTIAHARLANKTKLNLKSDVTGAALVQNVKRADAIFKAFPVLEA